MSTISSSANFYIADILKIKAKASTLLKSGIFQYMSLFIKK